MSRIGAVTGAIHPSMMSSMTSYRRLMILSAVLLQLAITVDSGAVLELQVLTFDNSNSRNWDDSCCDLWCWSDCDHIFTFSLDLSSGNDDCKHYYYWTHKTGAYDNQNTNVFYSDMKGVANPIITLFITPGWPAAVKFKVYIEEDDSPWTGNDPVDGIVQLLQLSPAASQSTASWGSFAMQGVRPSHKTRLTMNFRLYCQPNYYSSDCSVYCLASDSNDGHYTCDPSSGNIVCRPGWQDPSSRCTRSADNCVGNQCQNGATCVNGATSYTCTCAAGYTGAQCDVNINECASNPCQNSGTCTDLVSAFTCTCQPAFVGPTCARPYCDVRNPCRNGGTCQGAGTCRCPTGFIGTDCSTNRCERVVCSNGGTCFNGTCFCPAAFTGASCDLIQCTSTFYCLNGGTCFNGTCRCLLGFTGVHCEVNINECASNPCLNLGTCTDLVAGYRCTCPAAFVGPTCSQPYCQVNANPCRNGGTCVGAGSCQCPARYSGWDCSIDRCDILACDNGGKCTSDGKCSCPEGFVGTTCEINQCSLMLCMNGGSCQASTCVCPVGYTGQFCEININDCTGNPCDHDGTCYDRVDGFTCDCLPDWTGSNCSIPVQPSNSSSSAQHYSYSVRDQPSNSMNPLDAWFYASFAVISLLLIVIIILSACLCRQRRVTRTMSISKPAERVESVENSYVVETVVNKGAAGCSKTDKEDDDGDDDDDPMYQSIRDPPSPPPRYSAIEEDADKMDEVFSLDEASSHK